MTVSVQAIYESGVLRPVHPLALAEGELVDLTVSSPSGSHSLGEEEAGDSSVATTNPRCGEPTVITSAEDDYVQRLNAAQTLDEMLAIMATAPPMPVGYDLDQALIENRRATGERLPFRDVRGGS